jgi:putative transposase
MTMSQIRDVELSPEQRQALQQLVRAGSASARLLTRARILLLSDRSQGGDWQSAPKVAAVLQVHPNTVRNIRRQFVAGGLEAALNDKPRPGAKPKLNGEVEAHLTVLACSAPPDGRKAWTLRLLAEQMVALEYVNKISHVTIREWLKKANTSRGA